MEHLAPAMKLNEEATYVVWITAPNGLPQNVGILKVGSDRKGSLETKTPFKEFTVMVTAETSAAATIPSGQTVMDTRITMPSWTSAQTNLGRANARPGGSSVRGGAGGRDAPPGVHCASSVSSVPSRG